jgi:uncharacterized membrane protein
MAENRILGISWSRSGQNLERFSEFPLNNLQLFVFEFLKEFKQDWIEVTWSPPHAQALSWPDRIWLKMLDVVLLSKSTKNPQEKNTSEKNWKFDNKNQERSRSGSL